MPSTQAISPKPSRNTRGTASKAAGKAQRAATPQPPAVDAEQREALIRIAAYSFYERRGYVSGHELEDWLQAEMEVDRQLGAAREPGQTT